MNEQIETLFDGFTVGGSLIPFGYLNYDGHAEKYFTYGESDKANSYAADDEIEGYVTYYDFDVYSKTDYFPIIQAIKGKLLEAGWTWEPSRESPDLYDPDTGYYHKTICFAFPVQTATET